MTTGPIVRACSNTPIHGRALIDMLADDIMDAIIPEGEQDELPTGFSIVGHVGKGLQSFRHHLH